MVGTPYNAQTPLHEWNLSPTEAIALQQELAQRIILEDRLSEVHFVAGVDMALSKDQELAHAAVVLLTYPALNWSNNISTRSRSACPTSLVCSRFEKRPPSWERFTSCASGPIW